MRLLLISALLSLLSRAAGVTWHVGSTGQNCDVTCTSLNPSKSCALDSFASSVGWARPTETTSPTSLSVAEAPERV